MGKFVSKEPVAVTVEGDPNTIWIRPAMSVGIRNQVIGEATSVSYAQKGKGTESKGSTDVGAYSTALLVHNVVKWDGPDFDGVPCTRANILELDPNDALVAAVLDEIGERNNQQQESAPDPNSLEAAG